MEVLPDYEVKRFNRVPTISDMDRKHYFKLDQTVTVLLRRANEPCNKVGLWLSYIYFKVSGKFYNQKQFRAYDIRMATKILGVDHLNFENPP